MKSLSESFIAQVLYADNLYESNIDKLKRKKDLSKEEEQQLASIAKMQARPSMGSYKVDVKVHAQARSVQRRYDLEASDWKAIFKRAFKWIEANKVTSGKYMFHSKAEDISFVGEVTGKGKLDVITVYPKGTNGKISKVRELEGVKPALFERQVIESVFGDMLHEAHELGYDVLGLVII